MNDPTNVGRWVLIRWEAGLCTCEECWRRNVLGAAQTMCEHSGGLTYQNEINDLYERYSKGQVTEVGMVLERRRLRAKYELPCEYETDRPATRQSHG